VPARRPFSRKADDPKEPSVVRKSLFFASFVKQEKLPLFFFASSFLSRDMSDDDSWENAAELVSKESARVEAEALPEKEGKPLSAILRPVTRIFSSDVLNLRSPLSAQSALPSLSDARGSTEKLDAFLSKRRDVGAEAACGREEARRDEERGELQHGFFFFFFFPFSSVAVALRREIPFFFPTPDPPAAVLLPPLPPALALNEGSLSPAPLSSAHSHAER